MAALVWRLMYGHSFKEKWDDLLRIVGCVTVVFFVHTGISTAAKLNQENLNSGTRRKRQHSVFEEPVSWLVLSVLLRKSGLRLKRCKRIFSVGWPCDFSKLIMCTFP